MSLDTNEAPAAATPFSLCSVTPCNSVTGSYISVIPPSGWLAGANMLSFSLPMNWTVVKYLICRVLLSHSHELRHFAQVHGPQSDPPLHPICGLDGTRHHVVSRRMGLLQYNRFNGLDPAPPPFLSPLTLCLQVMPRGLDVTRPADWLLPASSSDKAGAAPLHFVVAGSDGAITARPYFEVQEKGEIFTNYPCFQ